MGSFKNLIVSGKLVGADKQTLFVGNDISGNDVVIKLVEKDENGKDTSVELKKAIDNISELMKFSAQKAMERKPDDAKEILKGLESDLKGLSSGKEHTFLVDAKGLYDNSNKKFVLTAEVKPIVGEQSVYYPFKIVDLKDENKKLPIELTVKAKMLKKEAFDELVASGGKPEDINWNDEKNTRYGNLTIGNIQKGNFDPSSVSMRGKTINKLLTQSDYESLLNKDENFMAYAEKKKQESSDNQYSISPKNFAYVDTNEILSMVGGKYNALEQIMKRADVLTNGQYYIPHQSPSGDTIKITASNIEKFKGNTKLINSAFDTLMEVNLKGKYANLLQVLGEKENQEAKKVAKKVDKYVALANGYNGSSTLEEFKTNKDAMLKQIKEDGADTLVKFSISLQTENYSKKNDAEYTKTRNEIITNFLKKSAEEYIAPVLNTYKAYRKVSEQDPTNDGLSAIASKIDKRVSFVDDKVEFVKNEDGKDMRDYIMFAPIALANNQDSYINNNGEVIPKMGFSGIVPESKSPIFINWLGNRGANNPETYPDELSRVGIAYVKKMQKGDITIDKANMQILNIKRMSEVSLVKVETPQVETPQVETPQVETPQVETPQVETPQENVVEVVATTTQQAKDIDDVLKFEMVEVGIDFSDMDVFINGDKALDTKKVNAVNVSMSNESASVVPNM